MAKSKSIITYAKKI